MPRHKYIGIISRNGYLFKQNDNYLETIVSFETLANDPKISNIKKPHYQGALIEKKCNEMVEEYLKNPTLLRLKNKIIIGCLHNNWYIVDGQHRLEMALMLYNNSKHCINDNLVFCWKECKDDEELKELFCSLNKDSVKNKFYMDTNDYKEMIIIDFKNKMKKYRKDFFNRRKCETSRIYCIEEFMEKLISGNYFELPQCKTGSTSYDFLMKKNKEFYEICNYKINFQLNPGLFLNSEIKKAQESEFIVSLKNNNFIDWVLNPHENQPYHKYIVKKKNISKSLRNRVWIKEFNNDTDKAKCPIHYCNTILERNTKNGWHCGHVISEKNGGETNIGNLRPICGSCNNSMGSMNWNTWENSTKNNEMNTCIESTI